VITFDEGNLRFNYRVVGTAIDGDRVLLHKAEDEDFWTLPGGRGELLEPARETLEREMREELDVEIRVGRLVWVVENFFVYDGKSYHELALYFLMTFSEKSYVRELTEFPGKDNNIRLTFKWHQLDGLGSIAFYPSFLRTALKRIPDATEHIVHTDGKL
jgi:ADP-ribose pyrophosphatase YjhB (NUDIX family)